MSDANIAFLYDDAAYVETLRAKAASGPMGLMGRQVAGKEFLDAWLTHGSWDRLVALVRERPCADSLVQLCREHPSSRHRKRGLTLVEESEFHARFFPDPPARLLHIPGPLDARFAWARQHADPGAFALCGVTHTLSSIAATTELCHLLTAPYEPFDALICTSRAVLDMVRAVTGAYADHLRERLGGQPRVRTRLEVIPLGVNELQFRPPTLPERAARRRALQIHDDEVAVLFVGRLSHHAKSHPTPMYRGLSRAARMTGRKVHLLLSGWTSHSAVRQAFLDGARVLAGNIRVSLIDGTDPALRFGVWQAADIFTSLSDNIQETFGLVLLEAQSCRLPVVASDWNGYRDLIVEGKTGFLVPTQMLPGATASATSRLLFGEVNYDNFLAECSQAAVVDVRATAEAFARLLADPALCRSMGESGRRHVEENFTWARVIRRYEALWAEQQSERHAWVARQGSARSAVAPSSYPPPEHSFAGYPTTWLSESTRLRLVEGGRGELEIIQRMPLTNHAPKSRCSDIAIHRAALDVAEKGCSLSELDGVYQSRGLSPGIGRASIAWLLKHGLLELEPPTGESS